MFEWGDLYLFLALQTAGRAGSKVRRTCKINGQMRRLLIGDGRAKLGSSVKHDSLSPAGQ